MQDHVYLGWLLQFYRPVLSEKQQRVLEMYLEEDLSLAEIAEQTGISRQAVHDALHRGEATLTAMEEEMHLLSRYHTMRKVLLDCRILANAQPEDKTALVVKIDEALRLWEGEDTDGI